MEVKRKPSFSPSSLALIAWARGTQLAFLFLLIRPPPQSPFASLQKIKTARSALLLQSSSLRSCPRPNTHTYTQLTCSLSLASHITALHGGGGLGPANFSEAAPFTFCPTFGDGDELGNVYGPDAILKTRAHLGSSERVRRVLRRAMAGLPISECVCVRLER